MLYYLLLMLICAMTLTPVYAQTIESQIYYQDCSVLDLGEQDMSTLTEAEKIKALEDSLFSALNQSEECMSSAAQSSAKSVANAAGQGTGIVKGASNTSNTLSNNAGSGQSSSQSNSQSQDKSMNTRTTTSNSDSSKQSLGGRTKSGSSAVCDAVVAGLQGATTESEKAHFQALKEQYGC